MCLTVTKAQLTLIQKCLFLFSIMSMCNWSWTMRLIQLNFDPTVIGDVISFTLCHSDGEQSLEEKDKRIEF